MKVPFSWLKEFLSIKESAEQTAHTLTMLGLEVDAIEESALNFSGIVVGAVLSTEKHPQADHLCIAKVSDGTEELHIVCAAKNCRPGIKTALAKIGAVIHEKTGESFKIKKSKLRGIESNGMLCSHEELQLPVGDYATADGIIEFPAETPVGISLSDLFGDKIFEIALTPNLNYCSSIYGIARELSAITEQEVIRPSIEIVEDSKQTIAQFLTVHVEEPELCPRYACRVIDQVKIGPTPEWLKTRLEQCGIRSINNVVDATNYVLLEYGHPLHAFDYHTIDGQQLHIRRAHHNEKMATLDGKQRFFIPDQLLICDEHKAAAIAGIMGGAHSEVTDSTRTVVLESAYFQPASIRRTSKQLGLQTEASKRFERGVDPNEILHALDRATSLIIQVAGGTIVAGTIDIKAKNFEPLNLDFRLDKANELLGTELAMSEAESIFHRLGFQTRINSNTIRVTVPTYRNDIQAEIDLIEEIARIYGYDNINKKPVFYQVSSIDHSPVYLMEQRLRNALIGLGLQEFLTCDLISPTQADLIAPDCYPSRSLIKLLNPSSLDQSILRPTLMPGLLQVIKVNQDHQNHHVAGFEIGRVHFQTKDRFFEPPVASLVLTGSHFPSHWSQKSQPFDFYDIKGLIENFLEISAIKTPEFQKSHFANFHPGRQAVILIDGIEIGIIGELHIDTLRQLDIKQRVYFAELNIQDLMQKQLPIKRLQPLPLFPSSERDWTITLKEDVAIGDVLSLIRNFSSRLLEEVDLIDIYRNVEKIGANCKNATFHFVYRDKEKTIAMETVDKEHQRIINLVEKKIIT